MGLLKMESALPHTERPSRFDLWCAAGSLLLWVVMVAGLAWCVAGAGF